MQRAAIEQQQATRAVVHRGASDCEMAGLQVLRQHALRAVKAALEEYDWAPLESALVAVGADVRVLDPLLDCYELLEGRQLSQAYDLLRWVRESLIRLEKFLKERQEVAEVVRSTVRDVKRAALFTREVLVMQEAGALCLEDLRLRMETVFRRQIDHEMLAELSQSYSMVCSIGGRRNEFDQCLKRPAVPVQVELCCDQKLNGQYRFVDLCGARSKYLNESNDNGVFIMFVQDKWRIFGDLPECYKVDSLEGVHAAGNGVYRMQGLTQAGTGSTGFSGKQNGNGLYMNNASYSVYFDGIDRWQLDFKSGALFSAKGVECCPPEGYWQAHIPGCASCHMSYLRYDHPEHPENRIVGDEESGAGLRSQPLTVVVTKAFEAASLQGSGSFALVPGDHGKVQCHYSSASLIAVFDNKHPVALLIPHADFHRIALQICYCMTDEVAEMNPQVGPQRFWQHRNGSTFTMLQKVDPYSETEFLVFGDKEIDATRQALFEAYEHCFQRGRYVSKQKAKGRKRQGTKGSKGSTRRDAESLAALPAAEPSETGAL